MSSLSVAGASDGDVPLEETESYKTARAASGTLAVAAFDSEVCAALLAEGCASTVTALLESARPELVHRALVLLQQLAENGGSQMAKHLVEGGVVPAIAVVVRLGMPMLTDLAKQAAVSLSEAMKGVEEDDERKEEPTIVSGKSETGASDFADLD